MAVNRWPAGTPVGPDGRGGGRFAPAGNKPAAPKPAAKPKAAPRPKAPPRPPKPAPLDAKQQAYLDRLRKRAKTLSDSYLAHLWVRLLGNGEGQNHPAAVWLDRELDRRERRDAKRQAAHAELDRRIDEVMAANKTWSYKQAWEEVTGRRARGGTRPALKEMRRAWYETVEREHLDAERATGGQLLNPRARARKVDPAGLWTRSPEWVNRNASDEFKQWAAGRGGHTTWTAHRAQYGEASDRRDARERQRGSMGEWA